TLVFHDLAVERSRGVRGGGCTAKHLVEVLERHGSRVDSELGDLDVSAQGTAEESCSLTACYAAAPAGTDLFGERAGSPALRLVDPSRRAPTTPWLPRTGVTTWFEPARSLRSGLDSRVKTEK